MGSTRRGQVDVAVWVVLSSAVRTSNQSWPSSPPRERALGEVAVLLCGPVARRASNERRVEDGKH